MNALYQIAICDDESKILKDITCKIKDAFQQIEVTADYFCRYSIVCTSIWILEN